MTHEEAMELLEMIRSLANSLINLSDRVAKLERNQ